jgi:hypothetical protein
MEKNPTEKSPTEKTPTEKVPILINPIENMPAPRQKKSVTFNVLYLIIMFVITSIIIS